MLITILQNISCKCAKSFTFRGTSSPRLPIEATFLLDHTGDFRSPDPLTVLSGNESICFSLRLCFSNDVCSVPNSWRTRIRGTASWLDDTDKNFVPICLYCLNFTKFGQLILRKIIKIVATRCQILRLKCTKFDFGWGSALDPAECMGSLQRSPRPPSWI